MMEFDSATGTLPSASSQQRHDERVGRLLQRIQQLMNVKTGDRIRLLDIGCSTGALLMTAQREGFEVEGVEPATRAAQAAQASGLKVIAGTLQEASVPSSSFHAATLIEVIEHLVAPRDLLREVWRILKPGGILLVGTGNVASWTVSFMSGRWEYFQVARHGGHISFFTPRSLECLATRCGFRIERLETKHVRFIESYQASPVVYRSLKVLGEVLNGPARLLNRGHDMLAFLRKV
jgi:2-polyprenyl-3-methyl-5-hydroxy-6-metoxy-1,4-benzoquinol methylase